MRWIDRGPEPSGFANHTRVLSQGWAGFRDLLGSRSGNLCWYCERLCFPDSDPSGSLAPTVDHFCPLWRCPELSHVWSNWVYSCRSCNVEAKRGNWSDLWYVDPAAADVSERPEAYFDYDPVTGDLVPLSGLSPLARDRVWVSIDGLGLNRRAVADARKTVTIPFCEDLGSLAEGEREAYVEYILSEEAEFLGVLGMLVRGLRREGVI